jgi:3-oxoacyl-[acyl-carrier protein] reductase
MGDEPGLDGRVAVVTGAGAGLGRAEALALADAGARVVLNDLPGAADATAEAVRSRGGVCGPRRVRAPRRRRERRGHHPRPHAVQPLRRGLGPGRPVHLRGHFLLTRNAAAHWRSVAKEAGRPTYGRIVNTAPEGFLSGSPGQANYTAAKAGIAALTLSAARGLATAGVRANAICPAGAPR